MAKRQASSKPSWTDVKRALAGFDKPDLLRVIQDLYKARKENQTFLHTRFGLGEDVLAPYKKELDRWLSPDVFRDQNVSVAKAERAISDYRKAGGDPAGLAELLVFYCELATEFCGEYGQDDDAYYDSLVRAFEDALATASRLPHAQRAAFIRRLDAVCAQSREFSDFVGDSMTDLFAMYEIE